MSGIRYSDLQDSPVTNRGGDKVKVPFFNLKEDGDEAIVRFPYKTVDDFDILTVHEMEINGKRRKINCLRTAKDPIDKCPLCAANVPLKERFYIKLLEYVRQQDGSYKAEPRIWDRPTSYCKDLAEYINEYGPLDNVVFKVKRHGARGSMETTYSILYANQTIYKPEIYAPDFSGFKGYDIIGTAVWSDDYEGLQKMLASDGTNVPEHTTPVTHTTVTTTSTPAAAPTAPVTTPANQSATTTVTEQKPTDPTTSRPRRSYVY
jgi:hypothetical protein